MCVNCNCDPCGCINLTLPRGKTGADGQNGADGINGANGIYLKNNSTSQSLTTGTILQVLKTYTLAAALAAPNESIIKITAYFNVSLNANDKVCSVWFNGVKINEFTLNGFTQKQVRFTNVLTRLSATSVQGEVFINVMDVFGGSTFRIEPLNLTPISAANLDTLTNVIEAKGLSTVTGDITCEYLRVQILPLNA